MGIFTLAGAISFLTVYTIVGHVGCNLDRALSNKTGHLFIDGIDVSHLSEKELNKLLEEDDEKFMDSLSIWIGKQTLREKHRLKRVPILAGIAARGAWAAGRLLYKSFISPIPKVTKSGNRLTSHFSKQGGYRTALKDFLNLKPTNIKRIERKDMRGYYGQIMDGKYTLTVRSSSTNGQPTLQAIPETGNVVRKVRYIGNRKKRGTNVSEEQGIETSQRSGSWY